MSNKTPQLNLNTWDSNIMSGFETNQGNGETSGVLACDVFNFSYTPANGGLF
jgi:hypothetical protein